MIICIIIVIPKKKPRFQKEFIWRGQGYDCKCDFISNTKYNFQEPIFKGLSKENTIISGLVLTFYGLFFYLYPYLWFVLWRFLWGLQPYAKENSVCPKENKEKKSIVKLYHQS